jgi:hypothetical protein
MVRTLSIAVWSFCRSATSSLNRLMAAWIASRVKDQGTWDRPVRPRRIAAYVAFAFLFSAAIIWRTSHATYPRFSPSPGGDNALASKTEYYLQHRDEFNVIFLGDSRTYCGIHPAIVDEVAGSKSYNLAAFSNWLSTQYALVVDIAPKVPKNTVVVISVGYQNVRFDYDQLLVQRVYPIGFEDAFALIWMGFRGPGIWDNVFYYSSFAHILAQRAELRSLLLQALGQPARRLLPFSSAAAANLPSEIVRPPSTAANDVEAVDAALRATYGTLPGVTAMNIVRENGVLNSIVLLTNGGTYYRIEITPEYFRAKQREMFPHLYSDVDARAQLVPGPATSALRIFQAMLGRLKAQRLRVIVNEVEETPRFYGNQITRQRHRDHMDAHVRPIVERMGFSYLRINWDELTDADYFDYNHLNSVGSHKAGQMIGRALKAMIN